MDESSKNDTGIEQKPTPEQHPSYQQYLNTEVDNKSKKRRKLLIVSISVLIILAVITVVAALLSGGGNDRQSFQQVSTGPDCNDKTCFEQRFKNCEPVNYVDTTGGTETRYKILGKDGDFCKININFISNLNKDYTGKDLTCKIDHTQEFTSAEEDMLSNPADYDCVGSLIPALNMQNESNQIQ